MEKCSRPHSAPPLAYGTSARTAHRYDVLESAPTRHLYAPLALVLLGATAVFVEFCWSGDFRLTWPQAVRATGYMLAWNTMVMLAGVVLVAKWIGSGFGHVSTAVIRLAAVSIAPMGVAALFNFATDSVTGALLGWLAAITAYWALFCWLFDLDPQETLIAVGITTVMRWASYLIYWIALSDVLPSPF